MAKILKFPRKEYVEGCHRLKKAYGKYWVSKLRLVEEMEVLDAYSEIPKRKEWKDYTNQEKIDHIIENQWYLDDYVEYATFQRYYKQFDDSILIKPYVLWIINKVENGKI